MQREIVADQEALHGVAVVDCILNSLVRETEPVLHEVHAQHRFEWDHDRLVHRGSRG